MVVQQHSEAAQLAGIRNINKVHVVKYDTSCQFQNRFVSQLMFALYHKHRQGFFYTQEHMRLRHGKILN
jgi:hypothetical protein